VLLLTVLAALPAMPARAQETNVEPNIGTPGTTFYFFAEGFFRNEKAGFWVNAPDETVYIGEEGSTVTADVNGRADWSWTAPEDAMPGTWVMIAEGINSGYSVAISFEIATDAPPAAPPQPGEEPDDTPAAPGDGEDTVPDANMSPPTGVPGQTFDFYSYGFGDGEWVGYWLNAPDGTVHSDAERYVTFANDEGRAAWAWTAPDDAMTGRWTMVARGRDSEHEAVFFFEIVPPATDTEPGEAPAPMPTPPTDEAPPPEPAPPAPQPPQPGMAGPVDTSVEASMTPAEGGVGGTTFEFFSAGFEGGERVGYWANVPDGTVVAGSDYVTFANDEGRADWSWTAPEDAMPGLWTVVARGEASGYEQVFLVPIDQAPGQ
jgi:hypothetical protein